MATQGSNPAFPPQGNPNLTELTKREYFAAAALQGLMAYEGTGQEKIAARAVAMADLLVETLNQKAN